MFKNLGNDKLARVQTLKNETAVLRLQLPCYDQSRSSQFSSAITRHLARAVYND